MIASHPVFAVVTCDVACDRCVASAVASANRPVTCKMPLSETETQRQGAVQEIFLQGFFYFLPAELSVFLTPVNCT